MSIHVMTDVWDHSVHKGSALLLLLAIADHAHDDGGGAYPSVESLSKKMRMTTRNTRLLLRVLETSGELIIDLNMGPRGANLYSIPPLKTFQGEIPDPTSRDFQGETGGTTPEIQGTVPLKPTSPKPSGESSLEPSVPPPTRARRTLREPFTGTGKELLSLFSVEAMGVLLREYPGINFDVQADACLDHHRENGNIVLDPKSRFRRWMKNDKRWAEERNNGLPQVNPGENPIGTLHYDDPLKRDAQGRPLPLVPR